MNGYAKYFQPEVLSRIAHLELRARHVVEGFVSGMHKSPYKGFSVEFAQHRPYVPGDDIRHIDWRVYAKADRFFIKEYEEETNMRVHLLLDCSASMKYPEHDAGGRMTKWTYAATIAASLAHLLVLQQDAVGLTLFDTDIRRQLPPSTNRASLTDLAATIEAAAPTDRTDVARVFPQLASRIPRRGMVVILSDLLTNIDSIIQGLQRFRFGRHDVLVLHVLDQDELEFPFADRTLFEGMENIDQQILTDPQSLRQSYLDALNAFLGRLRRACLDLRVDYSLLSTAQGIDVALSTFLATRIHQRRTTA
ncbi:MAG: DUF58 domain-containing protein [Planctomycetes bacterium]|nr:DUF58 domain-containing protein [Planctomycetota bacterium]MBI3833079.1 DUF58 domain-containing protein [Planctomycetota bacterium]